MRILEIPVHENTLVRRFEMVVNTSTVYVTYEIYDLNRIHLKRTEFNNEAEETGFLLTAIRSLLKALTRQNQNFTIGCIWIKVCLRLYPIAKGRTLLL